MTVQSTDLLARRERYRSFLAQDADNLGILRELIDLEIQTGEFDAARARLAAGLERLPDDPGFKSQQATLALAEGRPGDAVGNLLGLLNAGIDDPAIRFNLAYAHLLLGDSMAARDALQPVIAAETATPEAHLLFARVLHHVGDVGQALLHARHYQMAYPDRVDGNAQVALLYLDMEIPDLARQYAEKAYALDENNREALLVLGSLAVAEGQPRQAKLFLEQAVGLFPESGRLWSALGLAHMLKADLPQAVESLRKSVHFMPGHIGTWHALAWCQLVTGRLDAAEQSFNAAMDIDHNFGETHGGLAVVAALKGETEVAERAAKVALRLDPNSFSARYAQSLLTNATDPQKAQAMLQAILTSRVAGTGQDLRTLMSRVFARRNG